MQLLVLILTKTECMPLIVSGLVGAGLGDPTVINCEGALNVIDKSNVEPPPIFGGLRYMIHQGKKESKMMMVVLKDDQVAKAKKLIDETVGGIKNPNTGIIFTVPVSDVDGLRS
ncbi:MAG: hypothetical protein LUG85_04575 [Clostridiales bacterium]|nr:hypothetical protein [Clostridiales bacterium]MCD7827790.1 hypothetical protein [Clostridiales bacterium]